MNKKNVKIQLILLILFSSAFYGICQDAESLAGSDQWFSSTDRNSDFIVIEYLKNADFQQRLETIYQVSNRTDRNFTTIVEYIYFSYPDNDSEKEYILYQILNNFYKTKKDVAESESAFFLICDNIKSYKDSLLRKTIMEKTVLMRKKRAELILSEEAKMLVEKGKLLVLFDDELLEESRVFSYYAELLNSVVLEDYIQLLHITVANIPPRMPKF